MQPNTNPKTVGELTGHNTKTNARSYVVSDATAALCDCVTAVEDLYSKIVDALAIKYGINEAEDTKATPYLNACEDITELLRAEVKDTITENMRSYPNSHADVVQL